MLQLARTRFFLEEIEGTEIKSDVVSAVLDEYLCIVFYAEMEHLISDLIRRAFDNFTEPRMAFFLTRNMQTIIRRVNKADISDLMSMFGEDTKAAFDKRIIAKEVTQYMNVIIARHQVGHGAGGGISVTRREIVEAVEVAEKILQACDELLCR